MTNQRHVLYLGSDALKSGINGLDLFPRNLVNKRAVVHCIDKLLLDRLNVLEEGLVVLDLLVEHGGRLLVQLAGDVVTIDEALALVQPLTNLTKLSRKPSVKKPLPVANLNVIFLLNVQLITFQS